MFYQIYETHENLASGASYYWLVSRNLFIDKSLTLELRSKAFNDNRWYNDWYATYGLQLASIYEIHKTKWNKLC